MPKKAKKEGKNISRYTYENSGFNGFRVCKSFLGESFQKYYSVKEYGSVTKARQAAIRGRDNLISFLSQVRLRNGKLTKADIARCKEALSITKEVV